MSKRKEIILQETLNTPEVWNAAMEKEKLYVIDVHQKWCGPCKAITGMLKRIKNELGDNYLQFATAEADSIPQLETYRGHCEPVFLFYGCGQLVAYVHGCNAPLLQRTITETLQLEHQVLDGKIERKLVEDSRQTESKEEVNIQDDEEPEVTIHKEITVALIKPDVVSNGQVDEILEKIQEAGIELLHSEDRLLSEEEATIFYQNKQEEEYFGDLISYVTSGPCKVLVLTKSGTGEGVIDQWRDIIGPFDAAVAKESNPESLRAIYGTDAKANALHGSSSKDEAARELGFFFPDYEPPLYRGPSAKSRASVQGKQPDEQQLGIQRTLAIIRPDALKKHKDAILEKIKEAGFEISMLKEMQLSEEQVKLFYKDHTDEEYFDKLVKQMTSGPVLALCLAHSEAIQKWRNMLGPKIPEEALEQDPSSLRAQFHIEDSDINMLHGSDSEIAAEGELQSIFKVDQTLAVIKPDAVHEKELIMEKLKEAGFMISCQKDMQLTKEVAGEIYKSKEGTEFYDDLIEHMTSGPTLMMVLSAEDAVEKLRTIMGPTDPELAKSTSPDSLRAIFAKSIKENAIHSPSNQESANEKIKIIFGDVDFSWDGSTKSAVPIEIETKENETLATDETQIPDENNDENKEVSGSEEKETEDSLEAQAVEENSEEQRETEEEAHQTEEDHEEKEQQSDVEKDKTEAEGGAKADSEATVNA